METRGFNVINEIKGTVTREKIYIDPETSQLVTAGAITDAVDRYESPRNRLDWMKLYLSQLPELAQAFNSPAFTVFVFIVSQIDYGTNIFTATRTLVSRKTGVSLPTVNRVFDKFFAIGLLN